MHRFSVKTRKKREVIDITDRVEELLGGKKLTGTCAVFVLHTTAALTTADLDPGTDRRHLGERRALLKNLATDFGGARKALDGNRNQTHSNASGVKVTSTPPTVIVT